MRELGRHALGGPGCGFRFRPGCRLWFSPLCRCRECSLCHIFQGFDQEAYANASGAFGNIGLFLTRPRCASNIYFLTWSISAKILNVPLPNTDDDLMPVVIVIKV